MSDFPASGYISNNARTEGEQKTAFEDIVASAKQLPGGSAETTLVIAAGVVTPTSANHALDTEGSGATDDLTNIAQANQPDGRIVMFRNTSAGRVVVLKHGAGGAGQLQMQGAVDLALDDPADFIVFRRDGALWTEVGRNRRADRGVVPRGHISGFQMSNNVSDPTNDIDIGIGEAASDDAVVSSRVLLAGGAMTKRLDAVWASGSTAGGRISTESIGNGTWHVLAFRRSGGAIDYCLSTSLSPTLPDSGTNKRLIGSILREAGFIVGFVQDGDFFQRKSPALSLDITNPGGLAFLAQLHVPLGITLRAMLNVVARDSVANRIINISDLATDDLTPSVTSAPLGNTGNASGGNLWFQEGQMVVRTNTSGQVRYRFDVSGTGSTLRIATVGWWHPRGRD
jgi:hypothetical protein